MANRNKLIVVVNVITRDGTVRTPEEFNVYYKAETERRRQNGTSDTNKDSAGHSIPASAKGKINAE